jgi:hypothetical protein
MDEWRRRGNALKAVSKNVSFLSEVGIGSGYAYRVNVHERDTSERSDDGDELVQVVGAKPCDHGAKSNHGEAEDILLPLDPRVILASPAEKLLTRDFDRRVDLQRRREQNGYRVDELYTVDELVVLTHVRKYDGLGVATVRSVGQSANADHADGDDGHDACEHLRELGRVLHASLDGNN